MWRSPAVGLLKRAVTTTRPTTDLLKPIRPYCVGGVGGGGGGGDESRKKGTAERPSHTEAKNLLSPEKVEALKEKLRIEDKEVITQGELLKICLSSGVASSSDEAAAFSRDLDDAGVVMLFRDKVHLHPDKVVDMVQRAIPLALLPDDSRRDEFLKLQEKKGEIDMVAQKEVRHILWAGLGLSLMHVGLFFRLTFWEFSWDVMEPIAFFTTSAGIVVGYGYFLFTAQDPTYQDLLKRLFISRQRKLFKRHNFDVCRFVELQRQCKHLESCASIKKRIGVEVDLEDLPHGH